MTRQRYARLLLVLKALVAILIMPQSAMAERLRVFAAASLKTAMDDIGADWRTDTGKEITMVYAGSSALAKQITGGAPADLFISADLAWMDLLQSEGLIDDTSRRNLLGNTLVLIAPADSQDKADLSKPADLVSILNGGRMAVADVKAVPAGRYAKAALRSLGLWSELEPHLAQAENVRVALAYVARGETPLGIVYGSDALIEPKVKVIATFPADSHPPVIYPAAIVKSSANADAKRFLEFLDSPVATSIFERNGFKVLRTSE